MLVNSLGCVWAVVSRKRWNIANFTYFSSTSQSHWTLHLCPFISLYSPSYIPLYISVTISFIFFLSLTCHLSPSSIALTLLSYFFSFLESLSRSAVAVNPKKATQLELGWVSNKNYTPICLSAIVPLLRNPPAVPAHLTNVPGLWWWFVYWLLVGTGKERCEEGGLNVV